jgi:hypothetical protein
MGMSFAGGGNEKDGNGNGGRTGMVAEHGNGRLLLQP